MIDGLWTLTEFNARGRSLRRCSPLVVAVARALDAAHAAGGREAQAMAVDSVHKAVERWARDRERRCPGESWHLSSEAPRMRAVLAQTQRLLSGEYEDEVIEALDRQNREVIQPALHRARERISTVTGIGDASRPPRLPDRTRPVHPNYWLEAIDPNHRHVDIASAYNALWQNSSTRADYPTFVRNLPADLRHSIDTQGFVPGLGNSASPHVQYLTEREQRSFGLRIDPRDGLLYRDRDRGRPFHTGDLVADEEWVGWALFVLNEQDKLFAHAKLPGEFQHSSFTGGRPVKSAGLMLVDHGRLIAIVMHSGHYQSTSIQALNAGLAILAMLSGNGGGRERLTREQIAASRDARRRLGDVLLGIRHASRSEYVYVNALEFMLAAGQMEGLARRRPPRPLSPNLSDDRV